MLFLAGKTANIKMRCTLSVIDILYNIRYKSSPLLKKGLLCLMRSIISQSFNFSKLL